MKLLEKQLLNEVIKILQTSMPSQSYETPDKSYDRIKTVLRTTIPMLKVLTSDENITEKIYTDDDPFGETS